MNTLSSSISCLQFAHRLLIWQTSSCMGNAKSFLRSAMFSHNGCNLLYDKHFPLYHLTPTKLRCLCLNSVDIPLLSLHKLPCVHCKHKVFVIDTSVSISRQTVKNGNRNLCLCLLNLHILVGISEEDAIRATVMGCRLCHCLPLCYCHNQRKDDYYGYINPNR